MQLFYLALVLFLILTITAGLWRTLKGPAAADRMLSVQLLGTTSVAVLLIMAELFEQPSLRDVALLFALLSAVAVIAFIRNAPQEEPRHGSE